MAAASNAGCILEVEQQEDRLSKLPDDILLSVLDRLDVRGAARSSILSRRWRHLPLAISRITLDVKRHKLKDDGSKSALSKKARTNLSVAEAARSLLARRDQRQAVRVLYLRFYLGDETMGIVRAVDDAMARGCSIGKATFVILGEKIDTRCTDEDLAGHAARFLSCLDACPRAFAGLTTLHVESVKLGQPDINNLLGTCGRLKSLSLLNCDSGRDTALVVQHPRIAVLKLVTCGTIQLRWLPELVKLTCECWLPSRDPLLFGHVPRFRTLVLATNCTSDYKILRLSELLDENATVRELWMGFDSERLWIQPEGPRQLAPRLSNLRILNLQKIPEECGITWTFFLLEAAPLLEELDD
ncbi:F-box/FBD/LRR-repeat protein At5g56420-like [Triticum aestivum]|uniref:F-box/FBD/LRR-repeat protein At5g56420-like n=1 Tax=Triticum aestivum TaxID=4565 RepID=UPI001D005DF8|nr:F-box/FBD/LRR-repeat protein At5g56420-like [Triticum aestivum]